MGNANGRIRWIALGLALLFYLLAVAYQSGRIASRLDSVLYRLDRIEHSIGKFHPLS